MDTHNNIPIQNDPEFITNLKEYLSLEKKVKDFKEALKKLEERKKLLYSKIHHKMIEKKVEVLKLPGGDKIRNYVRKTREPLNKKYIQTRLQIYCEEKNLNYEEIYDFIYNTKYRKVIEKNAISKTKQRVKNKKKE